jgi:acid phosphatase
MLLLLAAPLLGGCSAVRPVPSPDAARVDSLERALAAWKERARLRHPNLDATLWTQSAVEYDGAARGAYRLAGVMMERARRDSTWTAALPQAEQAPARYRDKPPAVVLDVDETVLDNSAYQARLIRNDETYDAESWHAWGRERRADAVPGARAFTQRAHAQGVQVIYLTNRDAVVEAATRDNLRRLGFPVDDDPDAVLTQGERPGWGPKRARRAWVAERYRVLLVVGDNLGDFVASADTTRAGRQEVADRYERFWGTRWIVVPNPMYGSWREALYDFRHDLPRAERLRRLRDRLDPADGP